MSMVKFKHITPEKFKEIYRDLELIDEGALYWISEGNLEWTIAGCPVSPGSVWVYKSVPGENLKKWLCMANSYTYGLMVNEEGCMTLERDVEEITDSSSSV